VNPAGSALLTDLYQLTMLQAYFDRGMNAAAVFEFFVRKLPPNRNFLVCAGLEQAVKFLQELRFSAADLDWLGRCGRFSRTFVQSLEDLRFTGDVDAMPEGTVFSCDEPILRVVAPLREAQLVETRLVNLLHLQTVLASKAVRSVLAAPGRLLVDFGLRRAHGAEAGLLAARATYLAGFSGSATALAGPAFGIPVFGTMAHSFVQAHTSEVDAFEHFARSHPDDNVMLIDTYDTQRAASALVELGARLARDGIRITGVRIDSGDLGEHAKRVRRILDAGGMGGTKIYASGNLDEYAVRDLLAGGAPIDGFGIGTKVDTAADHPYLDCAYKLIEYAGHPTRKRSEGKATWPGRKQVYRRDADGGDPFEDLITLVGAPAPAGGVALLQPVLRAGARVGAVPDVHRAREHAARELARLPARLRSLDPGTPVPVKKSAELLALRDAVDRGTATASAGESLTNP
jgi:nicotinate phosphoribosyltransferase